MDLTIFTIYFFIYIFLTKENHIDYSTAKEGMRPLSSLALLKFLRQGIIAQQIHLLVFDDLDIMLLTE